MTATDCQPGDVAAIFGVPSTPAIASPSDFVSALFATLAWFQSLLLSLYAALFEPLPLPTSTRRAAVTIAIARSLGAVTPSHWPIRIVTEIPLAVMGSVLKRVPALDGVVYRPIKIKVDRERHEPDLSALGIPDYNDKSRVVGAEWVATRDRFAAGMRTDVVLFLHGGAFCLYSPRSYRPVTRQLAKLGFTVLAANYRKSPKHPFPCGLHDAIAAYLWLVRDEGVDPACILLLGDSAGGALALGLFQAISALDLPRPAAVALWSPCLNMDLRLSDTVIANADKDFLSIITNERLGIVRLYAGEHVVRAGKAAMDDFLAHPYVNQTTAQPTCPVLIQSSPAEQLAACISKFYANQSPATARVQHDLLVDTPHDPFFLGVLIPLTANQDLVQLGFQRLWTWWRDVQEGAVPFGKVQRTWHADGRVEVVDDTTGTAVQVVEE
ncbi:hypothetical protein GGF32_002613 [Allomyces javanicus]|nr:hypothetical protein GGF32_002613 [Allomyces javanicus]